jgi:DNA modification methylase
MTANRIIPGNNIDTLKTLPDDSVNCCITSPPYYGLRDYGVEGQIGFEETPQEYIEKLVLIFREVRRVLRDDGTLWVNIGDSYAGSGKGGSPESNTKQATNRGSQSVGNLYGKSVDEAERMKANNVTSRTFEGIKAKDLIGIPWMLAFALRADGWYLRQDIIWAKPNPMPESVKDRCTKSHEYIFLFSKSPHYYFDNKSIMEIADYDGRKDTVMKGSIKYANKDATGLAQQSFAAREHERWAKNETGDFVRNKRDVWTVTTEASGLGHFAIFPQKLILPCILSGCPENGIVLDPFMGAGTTALVAMKLFRRYIGCELNPEYIAIAEKRISEEKGLFD